MTDLIKQSFINGSKPTCLVIPAAEEFHGKQGHLLAPGISAQSVDAEGINLQIATIPPGRRSKAHKHEDHEQPFTYSPANQGCGSARVLTPASQGWGQRQHP
jgi:uncharacterized RmlC-like cupin family protein